MPYKLIITTTNGEEKIYQFTIEELKEMLEILKRFKDKTIEVELHKVKTKEK